MGSADEGVATQVRIHPRRSNNWRRIRKSPVLGEAL
jgi:hypothetical protein